MTNERKVAVRSAKASAILRTSSESEVGEPPKPVKLEEGINLHLRSVSTRRRRVRETRFDVFLERKRSRSMSSQGKRA
jgi:hypothetical protein